jgi:hypothetical protein
MICAEHAGWYIAGIAGIDLHRESTVKIKDILKSKSTRPYLPRNLFYLCPAHAPRK